MNRFVLIFYLLAFIFYFLSPLSAAETKMEETEQQINDFSLVGFGEKGKKTWDIGGKSADIVGDTVKFKEVNGNLYGEKENVKLSASTGDFYKSEGKIHLEQDVVIASSSGAKLTTDSLDWDRKNNIVSTKDRVNIAKENIVTTSQGATGLPSLQRIDLEKDVKLEILPQEKTDLQKDASKDTFEGKNSEKVVVTCDGPLSIDYEKNIATFNNNVKVERTDSQIYSDKMEIYFNKNKSAEVEGSFMTSSSINRIVATGNVKIVRGENTSYSDEATYNAKDKKITLSGKPKLVIYSTEDMDASFGN